MSEKSKITNLMEWVKFTLKMIIFYKPSLSKEKYKVTIPFTSKRTEIAIEEDSRVQGR